MRATLTPTTTRLNFHSRYRNLLIVLATFYIVFVVSVIKSKNYNSLPTAAYPNIHNTAILYLANQAKLKEAGKSLKLLFQNFNTKYRYPVIIFYDDKNGQEKFDIAKLLKLAKLNDADRALVDFEYLKFAFPDGITENNKSTIQVWPEKFPGYQHMIAFWGYHVFHHPRVKSLEYFWRLDTDSYILKPVKSDFIEKIRMKNVHYAYRVITSDPGWVVRGMAQFLRKYVRDNNLTVAQPQNLEDVINANAEESDVPMYNNNFEVLHVPTLLRSDMEQFRKAIYDTKRIYTHRWGDAPQRFLMINLFLDAAEVYHVCECAYEHQHWRLLASC